jgi:hypothetical protein
MTDPQRARGPRRLLRGALRGLLALLVALFLAELCLRALGMGIPPRIPRERTGLMAVVSEEEAPGVHTCLSAGTIARVTVPGGPDGRTQRVSYRINAAGLRNGEVEVPAPEDAFRIAVIGDSVTYGTGIALEDTLPKVLESTLGALLEGRRIEVINAGVPATNTAQQVAHLRWRVLPLEPDMVVVVSTIVDASGWGIEPRERDRRPESRVIESLGLTSGVWVDGQPRSAAQARTMGLRRASVLVDMTAHHLYGWLHGRLQEESYRGDWAEGAPGLLSVRGALRRARDLSGQHGFSLHVAMYPSLVDLDDGYPFLGETERLRASVEEGGLAFHDLLEPLRGVDPLALQAHRHDRHPNGRANRLAGRWLALRLLDEVARDAPVRAEADEPATEAGG